MNERQNINIIAFLPLFCAVVGTLAGVVAYFDVYPATILQSLLAVSVTGLAYLAFRHNYRLPAILAFFMALGFLAAAFRTEALGTRILDEHYAEKRYWVTGTLEKISQKDKTTRLLLAAPKVYGLAAESTPQKIRVSVQSSRVKDIQNGDQVVAEVYLQRPKPSKFSGDFNYQRYAFYEGFGAVGQVRGDIYYTPPEQPPALTLEKWREALSARIYNELGRTQAAAVLVALVTGLRDYVTEDTNDNYQRAGLSHLMAISGFNLGAVGVLLYMLVRLLWSAVPPLALRYNGKKPAAVVGLLGALAYTLVAGSNIPVIRAFIMIAALFLAVWVERPRVALRLLCIAAILVAWLWPEGVLTASYQMSFSATLALILWAYWHDRQYRTEHRLMQGITYAKGVWVTSLLAGLATMPFVVWHFQNLTLVGFLANLLAVPVMGVLTTPLAMLGFAAGAFMPWEVALKPAIFTIDWVNNIAATVAAWPWASNFVPQEFTLPVLAIVLTLLVLMYRRRWLWFSGAGVAAVLLLLWFNSHDFTPDVVSLKDGEVVLIKVHKGEVYLARKPTNDDTKLLVKHYLQYKNWQLTKTQPAGANCDEESCLYNVKGKTLLVPEPGITPSSDDCALADLVALEPGSHLQGCTRAWQTSGQVVEQSF